MNENSLMSDKMKLCGIDAVMRYENGEMDDIEVIEFFQALIDTGLAWHLQGHYGRTAARLIELQECHAKT